LVGCNKNSNKYPIRVDKVGRDSSVCKRLATGWTLWGSNPGGGESFRTRPDRPWGPPILLYNGYRVFPGDKAAGAWPWPPSPSTAVVKERVGQHLYSSFGSLWPVLGYTLPLPYVWTNVPSKMEQTFHMLLLCVNQPSLQYARQWVITVVLP